MKKINIAVIGAAGWIGGVHSDCWGRAKSVVKDTEIVLHSAVDISLDNLMKIKNRFGYLNISTNYDEIINNPEIDLIDICCDNNFHKDIAVKAAKSNKYVLCEKPLAVSFDDAKIMVDTVKKYNTPNRINFMYRKYPSLVYLKEMIERKELGDIINIKIIFERDWFSDPNTPYNWRFDKSKSGGGALVFLGSHVIDLMRFLVGDFDSLVANESTVIKERKRENDEKILERVNVDDITMAMVNFKNGATGFIQASWVTQGRKHHVEFEIQGTKGTALFNSERLNELNIYEAEGDIRKRGFKNILIGKEHPYGEIFGQVTGMGIGLKESFTLQMSDFIEDIKNNSINGPTFEDGLINMHYISKIQESVEKKGWVDV